MTIHIIICLITILFFICQFKRQKQFYQIYMCFWAFTTLGVYFININTIMKVFTVIQIVFAVIFLVFYFKARDYRKQETKKLLKMNNYLNNIGVELYKDDLTQ